MQHNPHNQNPVQPPPAAVVRPERRWSWAWLIPLAAVIVAAWLAYNALQARGTIITVSLADGHGLKVGDAVRYRGIAIGEVRDVQLADDLQAVRARVALHRSGDAIARAGTRFWVVRPQVGLGGVAGLETLIGPRYLAVHPPADPLEARPQRHFVGLPQPPVVDTIDGEDLEIVLVAPDRGSLARGTPVLYRRTRIGTVLSVALSGDATRVEARAHIQAPYVPLIRQRTRFWDSGGISTRLGVTGLTVELESLEALLVGSVSLATPPEPGDLVHTGHRFAVAGAPDDEWLDWSPPIAIGSDALPGALPLPELVRARLTWTRSRVGGLITTRSSRSGWLLPIETGLLGPANLLAAPDEAEAGSARLEMRGDVNRLDEPPVWIARGLALRAERGRAAGRAWPHDRMRPVDAPEDALLIADAGASPLPLDAARWRATARGWSIDPALALDAGWHGAAVVSRADGALIGIVLIDEDDDAARVAMLNDLLAAARPPEPTGG